MLVALLALTTGAWADDDYELTVHDSKAISNSSIPFYGSYMNNYTRNEMIYPAAELAVMSGADITSLTFYKTDDITESWGAASFKIYLMEVSNSTLSAYIGMTGATVVYEGSVDATGGERPVTINFTTPYRYNGGNLLVGVYQTVKGSASIAAFCGQLGFDASSGTSSGSYDSQDAASAPFSQQDFLPKTTFTYKPAPFDYELTVEASDHGSGQVKFFIDGKEVEGAYETDEGKTVTVKVTPDEGWVVDPFAVTAEVYRYWEGSRRAQAMVPMQRTVDLKYERTTLDGVAIYTFTMPASNVRVTGAYMKLSTLYFDPADRTNLMKVNVGSYGDVNLEDGKTVKIDKVEDILEGAVITLTANTGYKFRKVEVKKKAASTPLDNTTTAWTAGTYVVPAGGLTYSAAITVSGDVTLVLTDDETLTLNKGISLASGATLTVEGNGTMNVNGTNGNTSSTVAGSGMMCFKSGTLVATGGNGHVGNDLGQYGMNGGISHGGSAINGSLTLEGGNVTATGGNGGNAGGGGINWATGGNGGSAITGNVIINGGNWTANNGSNGTLLSGGNNNKAGTGGKAVAGTVTDNR